MHDQAEPGTPGRQLPWHHLWIIRLGPLGLCAIGLALIVVSMTVSRADAVEVAYTTLGSVLVIAGILIPRFKGPVEVSTTGVKGELSALQDLDPRAFAIIGAGAVPPAHRVVSSVRVGWKNLTGPVSPSHVSIGTILNAAAEQGWTAEPDNAGRYLLSSQKTPGALIVPGNRDWMATPELLRVLASSGLHVPDQDDNDNG